MATPKQLEANRRNAKLSTGPRTPEGKAVSRLNALKTTVEPHYEVTTGEDRALLAELTVQYNREFQPRGTVERVLVDLLVKYDWLMRRYRFLRAALTDHSATAPFQRKEGCEFGAGFAANHEAMHRLHRQDMDLERQYFLNLDRLERRQAARRHVAPESEADDYQEPEAPAAGIGFVTITEPASDPVTLSPEIPKAPIGFVLPAPRACSVPNNAGIRPGPRGTMESCADTLSPWPPPPPSLRS